MLRSLSLGDTQPGRGVFPHDVVFARGQHDAGLDWESQRQTGNGQSHPLMATSPSPAVRRAWPWRMLEAFCIRHAGDNNASAHNFIKPLSQLRSHGLNES